MRSVTTGASKGLRFGTRERCECQGGSAAPAAHSAADAKACGAAAAAAAERESRAQPAGDSGQRASTRVPG
eukprot:3632315-Alexandrium_andersonii.AAC.1